MSNAEARVACFVNVTGKLGQRYWASSQGRWVCSKCNDGDHRRCLGFDCECAHRDPI
jgi:hypothetical protein